MKTEKLKSFLFKNTSTEQTIAKNTFWLSISHVVSRIIKAGLLIYAARLLGATGYGVFSYALSLTILFYLISDIGIGALVTRQISSTNKDQRPFIATSLVTKLVLILIGALAVVFIGPLFTKIPEALTLLPIVALLIAVDGIRDFALAINRAKQKMEIEAGIYIATNVAIVASGIFALLFFGTSKALMISYVVGSSIGLILTLAILGKYFSGIWKSFDKKLVKKIIQDAWPFALLGLLGVVMINTDIIMLGLFRDASEVGLYSAAQKPIQVLYIIPAILASAFLPAITRLANRKDRKLKKILEQTITAALLIGFPITLGGIALGKKLMNLIFGSQYLDATLSFQILLITILIVFPSVIIANAVFAYNKQKSFMGFLALGAAGNVLLNILLIPKYGIDGSAVATIGAELTANTFIWMKMKKINHFSVLPYMKKIALAAGTMVAFTIFMQFLGVNIILNILTSAAIYFLMLKILKEPIMHEVRNMMMKLSK